MDCGGLDVFRCVDLDCVDHVVEHRGVRRGFSVLLVSWGREPPGFLPVLFLFMWGCFLFFAELLVLVILLYLFGVACWKLWDIRRIHSRFEFWVWMGVLPVTMFTILAFVGFR